MRVDVIAGTSLGAAVGAVRALGMDLGFLRKVIESLDLNSLLQVSNSTMREVQRAIGRGMIEYLRGPAWRSPEREVPSTARMRELFALLTAQRDFSDTIIPFAAVSADLETGERVVLQSGKLCDAIAASAAVPGIFPPVLCQNRYLIDGGIIDKIPVDVAIDLGADAVLAVDTGAPLTRRVETSFDALFQSERITSRRLTALQLDKASDRIGGRLLLLRPAVGWMTMFAFEHVPFAVRAGVEAARADISRVRQILQRRLPVSARWQSRRAHPPPRK